MSKELIERLRSEWRKPENKPPEMCEAADRIEQLDRALRQQAEAVTSTINRHHQQMAELSSTSQEQLAASQAREVQLRDALESMCHEFRGHDLPYGSKAYANSTTLLNRFLTPDTTALEALIAKAGEVMRERCAASVDDTEVEQFTACMVLHDDGRATIVNAVAAIRALPGVKLEDLK